MLEYVNNLEAEANEIVKKLHLLGMKCENKEEDFNDKDVEELLLGVARLLQIKKELEVLSLLCHL